MGQFRPGDSSPDVDQHQIKEEFRALCTEKYHQRAKRFMGKEFNAELKNYAHHENHKHFYEVLKRKPVTVPYLRHNILEFKYVINLF